MWQMTIWVSEHSCYSSVVRNNNRSLRAKDIAKHILPQVKADITFKVKQIQTFIKTSLNVELSYTKAWRGRRVAIDSIYGNWDSNFEELPTYINHLQETNPGTVVNWFHEPECDPHYPTFKYVFWAFAASIRAFHQCQLVISVDGTHLKGSYRGKLLVAVTKNANNYILPVGYAIVDEETVHSWAWFFCNLKEYVRSDSMGKLCVISDRHVGIMQALSNLEDWREPRAYHRYCLRHIRSNFSSKFKSKALRSLCWTIGSTTQRKKYVWAIREMKALDPKAWDYLKNIELSKWTLVHDNRHRRWGNLTTNISESMNNVLREARMLPIRALIDYTLNNDIKQYAKHTQISQACTTPLPPRLWSRYNQQNSVAVQHSVSLTDANDGRYRVVSRTETNDQGGNDYNVEYNAKSCSCGKWQMFRFPCSHALAVCNWRGEQPHHVTNRRFHTSTYRDQYSGHFYNLPDKSEWQQAEWRIQSDPSMITTHRGRRRARRIRNEMDVNYDEPQPRQCGICGDFDHNRKTCPNARRRQNQ